MLPDLTNLLFKEEEEEALLFTPAPRAVRLSQTGALALIGFFLSVAAIPIIHVAVGPDAIRNEEGVYQMFPILVIAAALVALNRMRHEYLLLRNGATGIATVTEVMWYQLRGSQKMKANVLEISFELDADHVVQEFYRIQPNDLFRKAKEKGMLREGSKFVMLYEPGFEGSAIAYAAMTKVVLKRTSKKAAADVFGV